MRGSFIRLLVILAAAALGGCQMVFPGASGHAMEGTLTPPPAGDSSPDGWSLTLFGNAIYPKMNVSGVHAQAKALQGKFVKLSGELDPTGSVVVGSIEKGRLIGTARRVAIDTRHPTGWMFATTIAGVAFETPLDPSAVMPASEQFVGKKVVVTGYLVGEAKTGVRLIAETLDRAS